MEIDKYLLLLILIATNFFNSSQAISILEPIKQSLCNILTHDEITIFPRESKLSDELYIAQSYGRISFGVLASYTGMLLLNKSLTQEKYIINFIISLIFIGGGWYCIHKPI